MSSDRRSRDDVVTAAGRLFAERGYHGTSMRDLGKALGLQGSSLYSHIESKEALFVAVVERGAALFQAAADGALAETEEPVARLRALVRAHLDVILDHVDESKTFLNEARVLGGQEREAVLAFRDAYEARFRETIAAATAAGGLDPATDVRIASIFILSLLNAVDRWYEPDGRLDRNQLTDAVMGFVLSGLGARPGETGG
jgi:AcrR family transcriptional regulator